MHCAQDVSQHGVCHGPIWNVSAWHEFVLHGKPSRLWHAELPSVHLRTHGRLVDSIPAIDAEIVQLEQETANRLKQLRERRAELMVLQGLTPTGLNHSVTGRAFNSTYIFQFETRSSPPVFLLSLNPVARSHRVGEMPPTIVPSDDMEGSDLWPWSLQVRRLDPWRHYVACCGAFELSLLSFTAGTDTSGGRLSAVWLRREGDHHRGPVCGSRLLGASEGLRPLGGACYRYFCTKFHPMSTYGR